MHAESAKLIACRSRQVSSAAAAAHNSIRVAETSFGWTNATRRTILHSSIHRLTELHYKQRAFQKYWYHRQKWVHVVFEFSYLYSRLVDKYYESSVPINRAKAKGYKQFFRTDGWIRKSDINLFRTSRKFRFHEHSNGHMGKIIHVHCGCIG